MADQKQLDLLQQGVKDWNVWRKQHPGIPPDLREADLSKADLSGADLSKANLNEANLNEANLKSADLNEADLKGADLNEAKLNWADLNNADLSGAHLNGACLFATDLSGAELFITDFNRANLRNADLSNAYIGWTTFGDVDLRSVKGLDTIDHGEPSTIGTNTLEHSEGDIPEVFLRGTGLSDTFIEYAHSLTSRAIEYYTCFISYSSKDEDFVRHLHADLRAKDVRCWYAPEDLQIGEKFWQRIDESIRLHDKLLIVLSEHSVTSLWVENEVVNC